MHIRMTKIKYIALLLFLFSGSVSATTMEEYKAWVTTGCTNNARFVEETARLRDAGKIPSWLLLKHIESKSNTTEEALFNMLLIEMVFSRPNTSSSELKRSVYSTCIKHYLTKE